MDFDQYFQSRSSVVERVLLEGSSQSPASRDWRLFGACIICVVSSMAIQIWASRHMIDPGFFARTSTFLTFVLMAGVWLLSFGKGSDVVIARAVVKSRNLLLQQTLGQLLKVDGSIAHRLATPHRPAA